MAVLFASNVATAQNAPARNPPGMTMERGTVQSVTGTNFTLKTATGVVSLKIAQPFHVYTRVSSDLSKVKDSSFVGVTSIALPNGSQQATEIHILPESLRGIGDGSYMMKPTASAPHSRMTNGVTSRMTNGSPTRSRMTNGSVKGGGGSSLIVHYYSGDERFAVPANTPVTTFQITQKSLTVGEQAVAIAKKTANGQLVSSSALVIQK
jgi:hypothetical protein